MVFSPSSAVEFTAIAKRPSSSDFLDSILSGMMDSLPGSVSGISEAEDLGTRVSVSRHDEPHRALRSHALQTVTLSREKSRHISHDSVSIQDALRKFARARPVFPADVSLRFEQSRR